MTKHNIRTLFRVVGGNSQRRVLNEYEIITYLLVSEHETYYWAERDGKIEKQNKRTTSNSEWFPDLDSASKAIQAKLDGAIQSVHFSIEHVCQLKFIGLPYRSKFYIGRFRKERFSLECFRWVDKTGKGAYRIDRERTRTAIRNIKHSTEKKTVEVPFGRNYIYPHQSKPHNHASPTEKWLGVGLDTIRASMRLYADERIKYLRLCKSKQEDWVRQYRRLTNYEQDL